MNYKDIDNYFQFLKNLAKEDRELQEKALNKIKSSNEEDLLMALRLIGTTLGSIRYARGLTLKSFVDSNFKDNPEMMYRLYNIERGLDIPETEIVYKYLSVLNGEEDVRESLEKA